MNKKMWLLPVAAGLAVFSSISVGQDQMSPPMSQGQAAQQDQMMFGSQLMTPDERTQYRNKMRSAKTAQEREQIRANHHQQMLERAKERGVTLPDTPPPRGSGMGGGMGPGGGMKPGGGMGGGMGPGGGGRNY